MFTPSPKITLFLNNIPHIDTNTELDFTSILSDSFRFLISFEKQHTLNGIYHWGIPQNRVPCCIKDRSFIFLNRFKNILTFCMGFKWHSRLFPYAWNNRRHRQQVLQQFYDLFRRSSLNSMDIERILQLRSNRVCQLDARFLIFQTNCKRSLCCFL